MSPAASCRSRRCPAVVLLPFVALWGLATNDQAIFIVLAGSRRRALLVDARPAAGRLVVRLATTIFFAFGTVFWFTAQLGTTWYQAHVVAVGLTLPVDRRRAWRPIPGGRGRTGRPRRRSRWMQPPASQ